MTAHNELFECSDCFHIGPLDIHGQCERCQGDAVQSIHQRDIKLHRPDGELSE